MLEKGNSGQRTQLSGRPLACHRVQFSARHVYILIQKRTASKGGGTNPVLGLLLDLFLI